MKIAYFDCFSGISGDMAVGALIDAGVPLTVVEEALRAVALDHSQASVSIRVVSRSQISAVKFDVVTPAGGSEAGGDVHTHAETSHADERTASWSESGQSVRSVSLPCVGTSAEVRHHAHVHGHSHTHHTAGDHGSSYASIVQRIDGSSLSERAKDITRRIFRAIGLAEARVHGTTLEDVHFHEVGGYDSIADIVAVAVCLEHLGVDAVYTSVIPLGSGGLIDTQHGRMPLPAPATLEILKGYPVQLTTVPFELTTPTGAGIVKALSRGVLAGEQLQVERVGFGAGTRELADRPNLLRVVLGEIVADDERDEVVVIESNIDDMKPQIFPFVIERLMESGALDAYLCPVIMKKGRPGMVLSVIAQRAAVDELTKVIYRETTTIGVRYHEMSRRKLRREEILVPSEWGTVRMKRIVTPDGVRVAPEYDEARRIAREQGVPLHTVLELLDQIAHAAAGELTTQ